MDQISKINLGGIDYDIRDNSKLTPIAYADLASLRDNGKLIAGSFYRITDYVTTTAQENTQSAGHPFDVIVLALSKNTLAEEAYAIQSARDTDGYFANSNLTAWKLWYCLDNDAERFAWADTENGKGVIYRMIDEFENDIPYDFKNIQFINTKNGIFAYTFSLEYVNGGQLAYKDYSFSDNCRKNVINEYREYFVSMAYKTRLLNNILFINYGSYIQYCSNNTFGDNCYNNTFGDNCYNNTFGNNCSNNTFGNICYNNTFGDNCYNNTFGDNCSNNTFGNRCIKLSILDGTVLKSYIKQPLYTIDEEGGNILPALHPDLSTQPSILPYMFMGNYVYEQLIPYSINNMIACELMYDKPFILACDIVGNGIKVNCNVQKYEDNILYLESSKEISSEDIMFVKLTYTSMEQMSSDYSYGYGDEYNY